jgi:DNA repair exonuclease SbcCD nuclease subunit
MEVESVELPNLTSSKEIILFADTHIHDFKRFNYPTEQGIGSRSLTILNVLRDFIASLNERKDAISSVFFLGDLFHSRTYLHTKIFDATCKVFEKSEVPIHAITGNHDLTTNDSNGSSIIQYVPRFVAYSKPTIFVGKDIEIAACPWLPDAELVMEATHSLVRGMNKKKMRIFIGHLHLKGAIIGELRPNIDSRSILDPDVFSSCSFEYIILGHIHTHQHLVCSGIPAVYCGHMVENNFGDEGSHTGYLILKDGKIASIDTSSFVTFPLPQHKTIKLTCKKDVEKAVKETSRAPHHYYRFLVVDTHLNLDKLIESTKNVMVTYEPDGNLCEGSEGKDQQETDVDSTVFYDTEQCLKLFIEKERQQAPDSLSWLDEEFLFSVLNDVSSKI